MKTVRIYIVRYKESTELYECLSSIGSHPNVTVTIINNYGILELPQTLKLPFKVDILQNMTRPDYSTGHLARNWNQAIINGFKSLASPMADIVICLQADAKLATSWYNYVTNLPDDLHFLACGRGDEFQMFTPPGIKKVGIYDERFCNIGYQEADYFVRNISRHPRNCSIIDEQHGRIYNPFNVDAKQILIESKYEPDANHLSSMEYHNISLKWFKQKYNGLQPAQYKMPVAFPYYAHTEFIIYPYFEKDIDKDVYAEFYAISDA